ncbi:hypothetical protein GE09DRAFT_1195887 [Coniochaeta sp. 2T2.1]|nr:hypothetical protein GE09DRAFT_1195887 [Coniochaeta sp. 2T2.1]
MASDDSLSSLHHDTRIRSISNDYWDGNMLSQLKQQSANVIARGDRPPRVCCYDSSRFLSHISLISGSEYACGVTAYASEGGLLEGGFLTSVWLLPDHEDEFCIAVTSNRGRTRHIGSATPRMSFFETAHRVFRDIGVTETSDFARGDVHRLQTPELAQTQRPRRENQGQDQDRVDKTHDSDGEDEDNQDDWDDEDDDKSTFFHSWGSLDNVIKLRVQRVSVLGGDDLCVMTVIGLQIEQKNGTTDILGQWDADDVDSIAEFYNIADHGPLKGLDISANEYPHYIKDIARSTSQGLPTVTKVTSSNGRVSKEEVWKIRPRWRLGWVFGYLHSDNAKEETKVDHWDEVWYYEPTFENGKPVMGGRQLEAIT